MSTKLINKLRIKRRGAKKNAIQPDAETESIGCDVNTGCHCKCKVSSQYQTPQMFKVDDSNKASVVPKPVSMAKVYKGDEYGERSSQITCDVLADPVIGAMSSGINVPNQSPTPTPEQAIKEAIKEQQQWAAAEACGKLNVQARSRSLDYFYPVLKVADMMAKSGASAEACAKAYLYFDIATHEDAVRWATSLVRTAEYVPHLTLADAQAIICRHEDTLLKNMPPVEVLVQDTTYKAEPDAYDKEFMALTADLQKPVSLKSALDSCLPGVRTAEQNMADAMAETRIQTKLLQHICDRLDSMCILMQDLTKR